MVGMCPGLMLPYGLWHGVPSSMVTVLGIRDGWVGLLEGDMGSLDLKSVSGILHVSGTVLGTSRTNPLERERGVERCLEKARDFHIDALVAIGGDDTLTVAAALFEAGMSIVGVPKTMDNDVAETDSCIGFNTAVTMVAEACDRLHTTANSHHRVVVVEVMGRDAGWWATIGGLAGGADFILIPEYSCTLEEICNHIGRRCEEQGKGFSIIVVSEGADIHDVGGDEDLGETDGFGHVRLDRRDMGKALSKMIERCTGFESRFGYMVAIQANRIVPVSLEKVTGKTKKVDLALYELAKVFY